MAIIYSSFSNDLQANLGGLLGEYTNLLELFNDKKIKRKLDFKPAYGHTVKEITDFLVKHSGDIRLFHYSGHSSNQGLSFEGDDFEKEHLTGLFNTINSTQKGLECVFLNGCTNADIVEKLHNIPVVIGSKTPISNEVAISFTKNFFTALVQKKRTYKEAFDLACAAINRPKTTIVRGGGPLSQLNSEAKENEYFIVFNDEKVKGLSFPLRNYIAPAWYILMAILGIAIGTGFIYWDEIMRKVFDYECPEWVKSKEEGVCNVLVTKFISYDPNYDVNQLIAMGIDKNEHFKESINVSHKAKLDEYFDETKLTQEQFQKRCSIDYIITGRMDPDKVYMNFEPAIPGMKSNLWHDITSPGEFQDEIIQADDVTKSHIVFTKLCVNCSTEHPHLLAKADREAEPLKSNPETVETYQEIKYDIAGAHMHKKDTLKVINSLEEAAEVGKNDLVLAARTDITDLQLKMDSHQEAFNSQSKMIEELKMRNETPQDFIMKKDSAVYQNALRKVKYERADNVVKNIPDDMKANQAAYDDLKALKLGNYSFPEIDNHFKILESRLKRQVSITVLGENDKPLPNSKVVFDDNEYITDNSGLTEIICFGDCSGEQLSIQAEGYEEKVRNLPDISNESQATFRLDKTPDPRFELKGKVYHIVKGVRQRLSGANVRFITTKTTNSRGRFDFGSFTRPEFEGKQLVVSKKGYVTEKVAIPNDPSAISITLALVPPPKENYKISGRVRDCNFKNTSLEHIIIDSKKVALNQRGGYSFETNKSEGSVLEVLPPQRAFTLADKKKGSIKLGKRKSIEHSFSVIDQGRVNYDISGRLLDDKNPIVGGQVSIKGTNTSSETDGEGRFSLNANTRLCGILVLSHPDYITKEFELRNFGMSGNNRINIGDISLEAKVVDEKYTISGFVNDCKFKNTVVKEFKINDEPVNIVNNRYQYQTDQKEGSILNFKLSFGHEIEDSKKRSIRLGKEKKIQHNFSIVDSKEGSSAITGEVRVDGKAPRPGAFIKIKNTQIAGETGSNGMFYLHVPGHLCPTYILELNGFESKPIKLRELEKNNVGEFDLKEIILEKR